MGRDDTWFNDDDRADDEYPDDEDDSTDTMACPRCGAEVYEDAVRCPVCGDYIGHSGGTAWTGRPFWWILLGVLGILALIAVLAGLVPR